MRRFMSFNHSACKTVLNPLEAVYLRLRKTVVERITAVKFRVDNSHHKIATRYQILRRNAPNLISVGAPPRARCRWRELTAIPRPLAGFEGPRPTCTCKGEREWSSGGERKEGVER